MDRRKSHHMKEMPMEKKNSSGNDYRLMIMEPYCVWGSVLGILYVSYFTESSNILQGRDQDFFFFFYAWSNWGSAKLWFAPAHIVSGTARILAQVSTFLKPGIFPLLQDTSGWIFTVVIPWLQKPSLGLFPIYSSFFHIIWHIMCAELILLIIWDEIYKST